MFFNEYKIDKCISLDSDINLYFRQLNSFKSNKNKIEFNFNALATQTINKKSNINLNLYLIYQDKQGNNKKEQNLTAVPCTSNNPKNLAQVLYSCEIKTKNKYKEYSSLELSRYNNTIGDIPEDENK